MHSRQARALRGFAASGLSTLVAMIAHMLGGGSAPHPLLLALVVLFGALAGAALAGRRVTLLRIAPPVAVSQGLFHLLFSAPSSSGMSGVLLVGTHDAHAHAAMLTASGTPAPPTDGRMLAAHVTAALLTMLALRFGEAALWGLLDTARLMLARLLTVPSFPGSWPGTPRRRTHGRRSEASRHTGFLRIDRRRGPPRACVA